MLNKLSRLLADAGISLTDHQKNQLIAYVDMLHKWNKAYNLTSVRDPNEMLVRHILDSIVVAPYLKGERFIDVGTGPGLPGIPLSIVRPEAHFTLLDSLGKRVRFLRQVQHELALLCKAELKNSLQSRRSMGSLAVRSRHLLIW